MPGILVGYDDSDSGRDALALGRLLAVAREVELVVAYVYPYDHALSDGLNEALQAEAEATLDDAIEPLQGALAVRRLAYPATSPARGLQELSESDEEPEIAVIGSKGRARLGRLLPGAVGWRLMHGAPIPVALAPRGFAARAPSSLSAVAVAFDSSPEAVQAAEEAVRISRSHGAILHLFTVVSPIPIPPPEVQGAYDVEVVFAAKRERAEAELTQLVAKLGEDLEYSRTVLAGDPARSLTEAAQSAHVDLLVCGSRGFGPVRRVLLEASRATWPSTFGARFWSSPGPGRARPKPRQGTDRRPPVAGGHEDEPRWARVSPA